ncbi:hypothetical protein CHUAL_011357 [Chamberlinius hualienensis]
MTKSSVNKIINEKWYSFGGSVGLKEDCRYINMVEDESDEESSGKISVVSANGLNETYEWLNYTDGVLIYQLDPNDESTISSLNIVVYENDEINGKYMAIAICKRSNNNTIEFIYSTNRDATADQIDSVKQKMFEIYGGNVDFNYNQNECSN